MKIEFQNGQLHVGLPPQVLAAVAVLLGLIATVGPIVYPAKAIEILGITGFVGSVFGITIKATGSAPAEDGTGAKEGTGDVNG